MIARVLGCIVSAVIIYTRGACCLRNPYWRIHLLKRLYFFSGRERENKQTNGSEHVYSNVLKGNPQMITRTSVRHA